MTPILAKDAKPGMRLSLDPDGNGRIVSRVDRSVRLGQLRILWTDGGETGCSTKDTLYLITPPQEAA